MPTVLIKWSSINQWDLWDLETFRAPYLLHSEHYTPQPQASKSYNQTPWCSVHLYTYLYEHVCTTTLKWKVFIDRE